MERKKSGLQKRLESRGWKLLGNEDPKRDWKRDGDGFSSQIDRLNPKSDRELRETYLGRIFEDVKVANAYDIYGRPIEGMRAIYVKGKSSC